MIDGSEFDMDIAHAWALGEAQRMGCTCDEEPTIGIANCDTHGVHLNHHHSRDCAVAKLVIARERIASAVWN